MKLFAKRSFESLSKDERDLARIIALTGGLGLGAILALSQAVRANGGTISLQLSVETAITFVLGFAVAFVYLNRVLARPDQTSRLFVRGGLIVICFLVLAAFIYPLRFATDKLTDRLEGVAAALCFMAVGVTLIRSVVRAAEREETEQEASEGTGPSDKEPRA